MLFRSTSFIKGTLRSGQVVEYDGGKVQKVNTASVLTAPAFNSFNSFDSPETVKPVEFSDYTLSNGQLIVKLPAHSVVTIQVQ